MFIKSKHVLCNFITGHDSTAKLFDEMETESPSRKHFRKLNESSSCWPFSYEEEMLVIIVRRSDIKQPETVKQNPRLKLIIQKFYLLRFIKIYASGSTWTVQVGFRFQKVSFSCMSLGSTSGSPGSRCCWLKRVWLLPTYYSIVFHQTKRCQTSWWEAFGIPYCSPTRWKINWTVNFGKLHSLTLRHW